MRPAPGFATLEDSLTDALERHLKGSGAETPPNLAASIRYSLLAPGKRIRPRLALAAGSMLELPPGAAMAAALAVEMVHCFTLIHDDLPCMDDDDFRRGRPANHKQFDEATALLAGDALMALAVDTLLDAAEFVPAGNLLAGLRRLSWAMGPRGVIGGQAAETLLTARSTLEELRAMHAKKTGALFSASLLVPKDLAGLAAGDARGRALDEFAAELGLAFQAVDDLEDASPDAEGEKPTSILFYLPAEGARVLTLDRLRHARGALALAWGACAGPLVAIAGEVEARLATVAGAKGGRP